MSEVFSRDTTKNAILSRLSRTDARLLEPHLEPVDLPLRKRLENRNRRIEHVYFLESGIASVVANGMDHRTIEVGIVGREGVTGLAVVMGADRSPHETFMQLAGEGWCMKAAALRQRMKDSPGLREALLRYGFAFLLQVTHTAAANGRNKVEERLARWLLMADDRIGAGELRLTHDFLAMMLGVHRPGVTVTLKQLEKRGLIRINRRAVVIADREGLKAASRGAYGVPEIELHRLVG